MTRALRAVLVGAACGLGAAALSLLVEFAILTTRVHWVLRADDSGGLGAVSAPLYAPVVGLIGFAIGAAWTWRRRAASARAILDADGTRTGDRPT